MPPLWSHVTDLLNWLEAKIQGAEVASSYTPGIRGDISRPAASAKAVEQADAHLKARGMVCAQGLGFTLLS